MITSNANQYLMPDYMLPTTPDAKNSPLALLAQTCSQIGVDTPLAGKSLLNGSADKSGRKDSNSHREKSSPTASSSSNDGSPPGTNTASRATFKPYEKDFNHHQEDTKSERKTSPVARTVQKRPTSSPSISPGSKKSPKTSPKEKSSVVVTTSAPYIPSYPSPFDVMASSLLASHPLKMSSYMNYHQQQRMKDSLPPPPTVCRDPYCGSCQLSAHLLAASMQGKPCPPGCQQCDKSLFGQHSAAVAAAYAQTQLAALAAAAQKPYVCSWVAGEASYCGKRFATSDELLQHLRTHTTDASLLLNSPLLNRSYPTPPLSPLSAARYHPYSKPPFLPPLFPMPPNAIGSSAAASFNPFWNSSLLYGPKLGSPSQH